MLHEFAVRYFIAILMQNVNTSNHEDRQRLACIVSAQNDSFRPSLFGPDKAYLDIEDDSHYISTISFP